VVGVNYIDLTVEQTDRHRCIFSFGC